MAMKLLEFPHSHYCEKARWALEYKGIPFEAVAIMPGFHMITVRRHAPDTSVPVLLNGRTVVQGSSAIIDYAETLSPLPGLTPANAAQRRDCMNLEKRMDNLLGENLRQVLYDGLLAYPDFIRHCFTHPMPLIKQRIFSIIYPLLRDKIYRTYVISDAIVAQARHDFDDAMDEMRQRLDGQNYLFDGQFSRADISVASMLSLLVMPPEHPFPWLEIPDTRMKEFYEMYREHPVSEWVRTLYRNHRRCQINK
jgi:glutathione S-transferase